MKLQVKNIHTQLTTSQFFNNIILLEIMASIIPLESSINFFGGKYLCISEYLNFKTLVL